MIEIIDGTFTAGDFVLSRVHMNIQNGSYAMLVGKTGSGKTTILEGIIGLRKMINGKLLINGIDVTNKKPAERGIGYVPQDGALFENLNVFQNISFSLELRKWSTKEINSRVNELSELMGISHLLSREVTFLSGGEKQRVCLARAIAYFPSVLCLDEPLSALDSDTHHEICQLLKNIQTVTNTTVLHITHNQTEESFLSDKTFLIENGKLILKEKMEAAL